MFQYFVNNQFWASLAGGLSMFCSGASYTWFAPLIDDLRSNHSSIPMTSDDISWILVAYESGCVLAPIPAGYLADSWGRKPTLVVQGPLIVLIWLLLALIKSKTNLYILRFFQGGLSTVSFTVLPCYLAEISQPELRGAVTSVYRIMWHLGMLYVYVMGAFTNYDGLSYSMIVPCVIFTVAFSRCPESPYFLLMKNRRQEALNSLTWLQGQSCTEDQISRTLSGIEQAVKNDKNSSKGSWKDLVATKGSQKALFISLFVSMTMIMTGACIIEVYETSSVAQISNSDWEANIITVVLGAMLVIVTLPTFFLVDRLGRRPILLSSCFGSGLALLAGAVVLYFIEVRGLNWPSLMYTSYAFSIIALCMVTYGLEPVVPMLQSELFTSNTRGLVSGIITLFMDILTMICLKAYQIVQDCIGLYVMYFIFFCFASAGYVVIYLFVPETKGKSLEEIQKMLS